MSLHIVTANLNGIRAALRRGGMDWLARCGADVLALQEVRATEDETDKALASAGLADWHRVVAPGMRAGHAGVALLSRAPLTDVHVGPGPDEFAMQGRWIDAAVPDPDHPGREVRVVSVYVHTGEAEGPRRDEKDRFLAAMGDWMGAHGDAAAVVCGDLNVAHTNHDIKNWRGNRGRPGFLESERAHLSRWVTQPPDGLGWADLGRRFGGDGPGPYTWWSYRGRGFDTDGGWRIDAVLASSTMAARATDVVVHKAPTYAQRWSDHAAVSATFI